MFFLLQTLTFFCHPLLVFSGLSANGGAAVRFLICPFIYGSFLNFKVSRKACSVQSPTLASSSLLCMLPPSLSISHSLSLALISDSARVHLGIICGLSTVDAFQTQYSQPLCFVLTPPHLSCPRPFLFCFLGFGHD